MEDLKENIDNWVKKINARLTEAEYSIKMMGEMQDDIQHNYELIYELKSIIDEVRQELQGIKIIQIIQFKNSQKKENKISKVT